MASDEDTVDADAYAEAVAKDIERQKQYIAALQKLTPDEGT